MRVIILRLWSLPKGLALLVSYSASPNTRRTPQHTAATTDRRLREEQRTRLVRIAKQSLGSRSALHKKRLVGSRAGAAGCAEIENQIGPGRRAAPGSHWTRTAA